MVKKNLTIVIYNTLVFIRKGKVFVSMLKDLILKEDMEKKYIEQLKSDIMREKTIAAWGTGRGAKKLLQFMQMIDWQGELLFIDSNCEKCNVLYEGFLTIEPNTFFEKKYTQDTCIVITCADVGGGKADY